MKNRILAVLLATMLALSAGLVGCGQSAADAEAVVSESAGNLSVMKEDTASWVQAGIGMALAPTDIVKCGDNSGAEITFLDRSTVELEPGTELEVAELVISTETDRAIIRLRLIIGSIIFRVANIIDPSSRYEVETPTGEVAVRGSAVQITVSEDGTTLVCNLEGEIWAIAEGVELQVPEGECCIIRSGQPPELVVVFPDPNLEAAIREAIAKPSGDIYASDLQGLTSLSVRERGVMDLTGLEYCTNLTHLLLLSNPVNDISPLANLANLTTLRLVDCEISDISPLANLTSLTNLLFYVNQISDISPLANLTNLTNLYVGDNQVNDISPLANLTNLIDLWLTENQISDISPLANLTNLLGLDLSLNPISDISPLANLTNLTLFCLSGHDIDEISSVVDLTKLTWLELSGDQISDISGLAECGTLTVLRLYDTQISDISPLANLTGLTELSLIHNQISDISPLVANLGLGGGDEVNLDDNPLSSDSINIYIPELEARGVSVSY